MAVWRWMFDVLPARYTDAIDGALTAFWICDLIMPKYIVRYGSMRALGVLSTRGGDRFTRGARVIARTNRGLESGEVLIEANERAVARLKDPAHGQILRSMTTEDDNELSHIEANLSAEFETCQRYVKQLKLQMELVDIEHVFGGERIVIYYVAEKRVDFRDLVRQLASEFQTRIEMRQIGVRDEAKLMADYGDCGKPVCCNTHLSTMPPVSMRMAKLQKATLDPTKISGRCGRLKCCLRYEFDTYEQLQKDLPPIGSDIVTEHGESRVLGHAVLTRQLTIQTEDRRRMVIEANEVLSVTRRGLGKRSRRSKAKPAEKEPTVEAVKNGGEQQSETGANHSGANHSIKDQSSSDSEQSGVESSGESKSEKHAEPSQSGQQGSQATKPDDAKPQKSRRRSRSRKPKQP